MTSVNYQSKNQGKEFDYLCVDDFLKNVFDARALATAFEIRLIDFIFQNKQATLDSLTEQLGTDSHGMRLLLDLLVANRVVENENGKLSLTKEFVHALQFRDLLELKLIITNYAAHDLLDYFSHLVSRPEQFVREARFFRLFSYNRCFDNNQENYELTRRWMRITTTFTKYEAQVCMKYHDFSRYRRILDIGGNSGEFVRQICRRYPGISATVFDLPVVCDIGL